MKTWIRARDGHQAELIGETNRFGFAPYRHDMPGERIEVVFHSADGAARSPAEPGFDSKDFERKQDVERASLAKRRAKDNWI